MKLAYLLSILILNLRPPLCTSTFTWIFLIAFLNAQTRDKPYPFHVYTISLYSLIWDFLLCQINIWTTTTWSNVWVILPKPPWYEFLIRFLISTPASKYLYLTTFSNIHVLIFVIVSKCRKNPKLMNIVIYV